MMIECRICCFCEKWASGGIESFLTNILTHMDLSGLSVDIVAVNLEKSIFTEKLEKLGIHFRELSGNRNRILENSKRFRKLLQERKYDVVHVNAFHGGALYYLYLAKREGIPVRIAHSHCAALHRGKLYGLKMMIHERSKKLFLRNATERWACSKNAASFLFCERGRDYGDFRFVPNGIDVERFRINTTARDAVRKELGIADRFVIGSVGRLCREKNHSFLLQVFCDVLKLQPDSILLLVGDGEERAALESEANHLGIEKSVLFYGNSKCVEQLFWAMDVFAFPSLFEGFGIATIEAQAAGLPAVCSDTVPHETKIWPSIKYLSLKCGIDSWVAALCDCRKIATDREQGAFLTREKGYDVADVAMQIQLVYQGNEDGEKPE